MAGTRPGIWDQWSWICISFEQGIFRGQEVPRSQISCALPSGYVKIAIENGPFIVDFPIENGDFP